MLGKISSLSVLLLFLIQTFACVRTRNGCLPPSTLKEILYKRYAGYEIVTTGDLNQYHRAKFLEDDDLACPGLVKLDFFGDGNLTYGVLLINRLLRTPKVQLILCTYADEKGWDLIPLDSTDAAVVPVIWSESSGEYEDIHQENKILAKNPVLVLVGYESWAILYAWSGNEIKKIWLTD